MRRSRILGSTLLLGIAFATSGCDLKPTEGDGGRSGSARPLGIFSTTVPSDPNEHALLVLEQDAYRRETRFLDAANPGFLHRSTDVSQRDIERGLWSAEELYQLGGQLFHLTFTPEMGYGAADLPHLARFHTGRRGGPDATQCASCHWRGGQAGAGDGADNAYLDGDGDAQSSALARNPISLAGAGLVEIVATEMNRELATQKSALLSKAKESGKEQTAPLTAKGVSFGTLIARADGLLDVSEVEGLDPDLVIKPFGWKGNLATLRDAVEDSLLVHHGMESTYLVAHASPERVGPFGGDDPDGDGVTAEVSEGQVSALTLFIAMQGMPIVKPPGEQDWLVAWAEGQQRFESIGCATCHVTSLPIEDPRFVITSREGGPAIAIDLATEAAEPRVERDVQTGKYRVFLFSDLKRHDIGEALSEPRADRGTLHHHFLTRPLWGVARSRPYLHDARAPTLDEAILLHGGEAQASRDAYEALEEVARGPIKVYLTSLTRERRFVSP